MNKKRITFIAGFGVLALALIGFFAVWPPAVQNDQASGAIGAVKKHNAPQITSADVVLTDEAGRTEEKIVYGDYIADAGKLQSFSDALASRDNLASVEMQLASHDADLQDRFIQNFADALGSMKAIQSKSLTQGDREQLEALAQDFHNRTQGNRQIGNADMDTLNQRFAELANRLQGSRDADLASIDAQLQSATRGLQNRDADLASEALESIRQQLGSLDQLESIRNLQSRQEYLGSLVLQQRVVGQSRSELGRGAAANFGSVSRELASEAASLENRAIGNMDARLQSRVELANRFEQMNRSLGSMRQMGNRENLGDRAAAFNRSLGSLEQALQSREADIANRINFASRSELQSIDQLLNRSAGNRDQIGNRSIGNRDQMENRSAGNRDQIENRSIGNRDQMENRSIGNRDQMENRSIGNREQTLASAERYLNNLNRNLGSMDMIANRDQLQSMAADMANRADLASRANAGNRSQQ